jgi:hypothetical protein
MMVNDYKEREPEYRRYVASLTQNATALDQMYQYAYSQLPPAARKRVANLIFTTRPWATMLPRRRKGCSTACGPCSTPTR